MGMGVDPLATVFTESASGYEHVYVRVIGQGLSPGMKDTYGTGLCSEETDLRSTKLKCLACCLKERPISDTLIDVKQFV